MTPSRIALAIVLVAGVLFTGSRIIATAGDPPPAPDSPIAVLEANPLAGEAFAALAKAETEPDRKLQLHKIAARRAPRDLEIRAWLFEHYLQAGAHAEAMRHLDIILKLAPPDMRTALLPALAQLAGNPEFSKALVDVLVDEPMWRTGVLATLRSQPETPGAALVFADLRDRGAMEESETGPWLDALIRAGAWGQAYSLWASGLGLPEGESLPMLWDGTFNREPQGHGFGWRIGRAPGSFTELREREGTQGRAARLTFRGRPVTTANLEQALHLPPGDYRLTVRMSAQALHSYQGLRWVVACASGKPRYEGEPISGSFDWQEYTLDFNVPVTDCPGQWLRLWNPAPRGSASIVSGELWVDDVALRSVDIPE